MRGKAYYILGLLVILLFSLCSCTALQYRQTDTEIVKDFSQRDVKTDFVRFQIDSLNRSIRIQRVVNGNDSINIVFLHGSPSSLSAWRQYLWNDKLIETANLYAIDRPGYGYSGFGKEIPSIKSQSHILDAVLRDLDLDNIIVVGTSYGAPIAAQMAVLNEKVKGVVLLSGAMDSKQEKDIWASRFTQWKLTRWLVPTGYRVAGDEKTIHAKELEKIENGWKALTIPILHLHGDIDDVVPVGNINYTQNHFQNITTKIVKDVDHDLAWGRPEILLPELLKFITQVFSN